MTWKAVKRDFRMNWQIYVMALPMIVYFIVFNYVPMLGIVMAFQRFSPRHGYFKSPWIGLQNFRDFFGSYYFLRLLRNTFLISFLSLLFAFPAPVIFALLLNEVRNRYFKKTVQTISYMPHFISMVVIAGLIRDFTDTDGLITMMVAALGGQQRNLLSDPSLFRTIYVGSEIWQGIGFNSIIFLAALSAVDQELYEAAIIDGAGRWKQTLHITIPSIAPTIIIMLILRMGSLFSVGFEKIILLYTPMTYETADVISSFTYRKGLLEANYGYSTAVGLFNSVINFSMLLVANFFSRKYSETSLF
ncbi:MAG: sugar ABC transporter permease [Clostridiales bacterium]|jgi:putative aldouronate transport system permease protein|nr:sugar ABC transporter permease [Clostridiales bacterium]